MASIGCSCMKTIKKVVVVSSIYNLVINISNIHDIEDVVSKILLKTNQAFNDDKPTHSTF
jgi:predicted oxidoreductase (fatty acid repression mutant protein)